MTSLLNLKPKRKNQKRARVDVVTSGTMSRKQWRVVGGMAFSSENVVEFAVKLEFPSTTVSGNRGTMQVIDAIKAASRVCEQGERLRTYVRVKRCKTDIVNGYEEVKEKIPDIWGRRLVEGAAKTLRHQIKKGDLVEFEVYMFQTMGLGDKNSPTGMPLLDFLLKPFGLQTGERRAYEVDELRRLKRRKEVQQKRIIAALSRGKIKAKPATNQDLFDLMYLYENPNAEVTPTYAPEQNRVLSKQELRDRPEEAPPTLRSKLVKGSLKTWEDTLEQSGCHRKFVSLKDINTVKSVYGVLNDALAQESYFWLVLDLKKLPKQAALDGLQYQVGLQVAQAEDDSISKAPDILANAKASTLTNAINSIFQSNGNVYEGGLSFMLYAKTHEKLDEGVSYLENQLAKARFVEWYHDDKAKYEQFVNLSPGSGRTNVHMRMMTEESAAALCPTSAPWKGLGNPVSVVSNRWDGLVPLEFFNGSLVSTFAGCVIGSSGGGKTFFAQNILGDMRNHGARIIIVEHGLSYKRFTELRGGDVVEITPQDTINPFELPEGDIQPSEEKIEFLKLFIRNRLEVGGMQMEGVNSLLIQAIRQVYSSNLDEYTQPDGTIGKTLKRQITMSDFHRFLGNMSGIEQDGRLLSLNDEQKKIVERIRSNLGEWTKESPNGKFIDGESTINLDSDLIFFSTSKLSKDMGSVAFTLIAEMTKRQIEKYPFQDKVFWVDEAHTYLVNEVAVDMMDKFARIGRTNRLSFWFVSNSFKELQDERVRGVIDQLTYRIFLKLEETQAVVDVFGLPAELNTTLRSLKTHKGEFSELLFMVKTMKEGLVGDVLRVYPMPYSYWAYTQDNKDKALWAKVLDMYDNDMTKALEYLVEHWPKGFEQGETKKPVELHEWERMKHAA